MNCVNVRKSLVEYAEGLLAGRKSLKIERHLSQCESCRNELSQIRKLREDILSLEQPERDVEFWDNFNRRLSERLRNEPVVPSRRPSWAPKLVIVGATAMLILLSAFALMRLREWPRATHELPPGIGRIASANSDASGESVTPPEGMEDEAAVALADLTYEESEEAADAADSLMEEDWQMAYDEGALDDMYEQNLYDILEELTPEEYAEIYQGLESI